MTLEQLLKLKEVDTSHIQVGFWDHGWIWWSIFIIISLFIIVNAIIRRALGSTIKSICFMVVYLFSTWLLVAASEKLMKMNFEDDHIAFWEEHYVVPYIESLPSVKDEIVYIKIDPEATSKVIDTPFHLSSKPIMMTSLTITSKRGDKLITETNWYDTSMSLTKQSKPYIEYRYLPQNLSENIQKGNYNQTIHLPEDYEFTDIK